MMMEEDEPRPRVLLIARPVLDGMGVAELEGYVAGLREEIGRAEGEIVRKKGLRAAADTVFKR